MDNIVINDCSNDIRVKVTIMDKEVVLMINDTDSNNDRPFIDTIVEIPTENGMRQHPGEPIESLSVHVRLVFESDLVTKVTDLLSAVKLHIMDRIQISKLGVHGYCNQFQSSPLVVVHHSDGTITDNVDERSNAS